MSFLFSLICKLTSLLEQKLSINFIIKHVSNFIIHFIIIILQFIIKMYLLSTKNVPKFDSWNFAHFPTLSAYLLEFEVQNQDMEKEVSFAYEVGWGGKEEVK